MLEFKTTLAATVFAAHEARGKARNEDGSPPPLRVFSDLTSDERRPYVDVATHLGRTYAKVNKVSRERMILDTYNRFGSDHFDPRVAVSVYLSLMAQVNEPKK
jgi:hypothetical protein